MSVTQKMEGGGKVKKSRPRKKPHVKKQKGITSPDTNTSTPGNSGEVSVEATTSGEKATEEEEENPLVKIIRYVHYKLFERVPCTAMGAYVNLAILQQELFLINPWKCTRNM